MIRPEDVYTPDFECRCSGCGIKGVKMWLKEERITKLLCYICVEIETGKRVNLTRSDKVGFYSPAIPTNNGKNMYWRYNGTPRKAEKWWKLLPVNDMTGMIQELRDEIEYLKDEIIRIKDEV